MKRGWFLAIGLSGSMYAQAAPEGRSEGVRESLGSGAYIDWSKMALEMEIEALPNARRSTFRAVEQEAINEIYARFGEYATSIDLTHDLDMGDVNLRFQVRPEVAKNLWMTSETRYKTDGRVEVVATVPLHELVGAWAQSVAISSSAPVERYEEAYTGLLIDARGEGISPSYAPVILDEAGDVVFTGKMRIELASEKSPVVWVNSLLHAGAGRAGDNPLLVHGVDRSRGRLVLKQADAERVREVFKEDGRLTAGAVVILVDP